ncbi:MAG: hypothetical protein H7A23_22960 [Leptospiraceae bacterium]|nr:hypothetical protein [Leptospiraceae bacterium]
MNKELIGIKNYTTSPDSEKANDYLPFFFIKKAKIRNQINPDNFLRTIGILKPFFSNPIDAIYPLLLYNFTLLG